MNNYDVGSGGIQMIRSTIALPPTMVRFAWAWLPARAARVMVMLASSCLPRPAARIIMQVVDGGLSVFVGGWSW